MTHLTTFKIDSILIFCSQSFQALKVLVHDEVVTHLIDIYRALVTV